MKCVSTFLRPNKAFNSEQFVAVITIYHFNMNVQG